MTRQHVRGTIAALTAALLLAACGGEKTESLLASARDYLAKNDSKAAVIQLKNALQKEPNSSEARFLLGKALLAGGDPTGAEVELRKAMDLKYSPDQVVPLLAQAMLATGQAKKVLSDLARTELTTPDAKAGLQSAIAMAEAALGHLDKAREAIDAALAIKPDHGQTMIMKARLLAGDNDLPGAIGLLDAVLAKEAKNPEAWKLKGDILAYQKDADGALDAYRKAVDAKPEYAAAHAAIIAQLMWRDKMDEAGAQLEAMKKALPKNFQTRMAEAEYLYRKKDFKRVAEITQELLGIAPDHPGVLTLAGVTQLQLNALPQAEDALTRALKKAPDAPLARRMLATVYLRSGKPAKALETVEPLLDGADGDSALLSLAGDIYMQNGNPQKAEEYFSKAAKLDPKNATKQTKVALSHLAEGKAETAFDELERIASGDTGTTADMALIATAIRGRDFAKAMKAIDGLEKKRPNDPLVHALRGTVLAAKGDAAAGRKSFEKALSINAAYLPAAVGLANLDIKDNKPEDAKKRFEGVVAADPKNVQAYLALAELKARTGGKPDEVAGIVGKAVQASPNDPMARVALINVHLQAKDTKKAVAAAQDAVTALPDRPEIVDALGRAQQAAGDTNQALAAYGKLVQLMPGSPEPYLRMAGVNVAANNKEAGIQNLHKALDLKPDLVAAQRGLIMLHLDAKNFTEAEKIAREVKQQRPKETVGYLFEGDIAAARKDWKAAVTAYREGLKQVPATELAIKTYIALHGSGSGAEAEKFAASWLTDHAQDSGFRMAMAEAAMGRGDYPVALKHYQALSQKQPNNPTILNNMGWVLGRLKDPRALDYAEKANRLAPNNPAIMETVGSLLAEKGETGRALEMLEKAISLAPEAPALKLSLARVQIKAGKKDEARRALHELTKLGDKFKAQDEVAKLLKEIGN